MSRALMCDQCGAVLPLNAKGEHEGGEDAAWIRIETGSFATGWDLCSRSCAVEALADGEVIGLVLDAELQAIAEIVRTIAEGRAEGDEA